MNHRRSSRRTTNSDERKKLSSTFVDIQTDHLGLIERENELLLKDSPTRELKTMMFDEPSHTPPPIKSAIYADILREPPEVCPTLMSRC